MRALLSRAVVCSFLGVGCKSPPKTTDVTQHEAAIAWSPPVEIATGGGTRGPWEQNDSKFDFVDDPSVTFNARGDAVVVWVDHRPKDVLFQIYDPAGHPRLTAPVNISRSPAEFSWLPRVVVSPTHPDDIFVLWQEIIFSGGPHGGDMLFARSLDGGATFEPPQNLTHSIAGEGKGRITEPRWDNGSFDLAIDEAGTLYAAWTDWEGTLSFTRSADRGATFVSPSVVASKTPHPARGPALAVGPDHHIFLAWTVGEDMTADIRLASSTDGGATFRAPQVVEKTRGFSDAPALAVDKRGTVHVVYGDHAGGPDDRAEIRYVRSSDGGHTFSPGVVLSQPAVEGAASSSFPSVSLDARDALYVVWELYAQPAERPQGLAISYSRDGGATFTRPTLIPQSRNPGGGTNGGHQGLLQRKLAARGDGSIAVVNSSLELNVRSRVWLIRGQVR